MLRYRTFCLILLSRDCPGPRQSDLLRVTTQEDHMPTSVNRGWAYETRFWPVQCELLPGLARELLAGCPH